jgi:hypothetical protein
VTKFYLIQHGKEAFIKQFKYLQKTNKMNLTIILEHNHSFLNVILTLYVISHYDRSILLLEHDTVTKIQNTQNNFYTKAKPECRLKGMFFSSKANSSLTSIDPTYQNNFLKEMAEIYCRATD